MGRFAAAGLLAVTAGLLLATAGSAVWVQAEGVRVVEDVGATLPTAAPVHGGDLAPPLVTLGLAGAGVGVTLLVLRGRARRVVGVIVALAGLVAVAAAGAALVGLPRGQVTLAPAGALLAAAGLVLAGAAALRGPVRPGRPVPGDAAADDATDGAADEWRLAEGPAGSRDRNDAG